MYVKTNSIQVSVVSATAKRCNEGKLSKGVMEWKASYQNVQPKVMKCNDVRANKKLINAITGLGALEYSAGR